MIRLYRYVGPDSVKARAAGQPADESMSSVAGLLAWIRGTRQQPGPDGLFAATFVIDEHGGLRIADRRSEHVACAAGRPVLSAGELFFRVSGDTIEAVEVSNQSTGYCPEPQSWPAVAAALDRAGVAHPGRFTTEIVFRRCEKCGERNVVKEGWFTCGVCGAELPAGWNFSNFSRSRPDL